MINPTFKIVVSPWGIKGVDVIQRSTQGFKDIEMCHFLSWW